MVTKVSPCQNELPVSLSDTGVPPPPSVNTAQHLQENPEAPIFHCEVAAQLYQAVAVGDQVGPGVFPGGRESSVFTTTT